MAGDAGRPGAGLVQDLADQVVDEGVAAAGGVLDQQAGGQGALGHDRGRLDGLAEEGGDHLKVEGRADDHRGSQQGLDLRAGPGDTGGDRVAERRRDGGPVTAALGRRPQALHREQGVAPGPLLHRASQVGHAEAPGQLGHGRRRQGAELQHPADVGQGGQRLGALLGPDGGQHQDAVAGQAAQQEVKQLQGRGAGQVEVVEDQQQRPAGGQPADEGGDRLERPPPLQLGRSALVAFQVQQPPQLRHQLGQRPSTVPGRHGQPVRRQRQRHRPHRLGNRLQEERPLRLVAPRLHRQPAGGPCHLRHHPDQPRLPDPRLASDQHQLWPTGGRPRPGRGEVGKLPLPPDKRGLGEHGCGQPRATLPRFGEHACR